MEKGRLFRVLVVAVTFLGGFGLALADAPGPEAPAAHAPRKKRPRKPAPPKVSDKCTTDADCAFTAMADGDCCPSLCQQRAVSKASAAALEKYGAECKKPEGGCPVPECAPPRIDRVPACISGKCVARVAPGPRRE